MLGSILASLSNFRPWLIAIVVIGILQAIVFSVIQQNDAKVQNLLIKQEADRIAKVVEQQILEKELATTAIGLSLRLELADLNIDQDLRKQQRLQNLVSQIKDYTGYKNLWVQIVSPEGQSLYRSWSDENDLLMEVRPEFEVIAKTKRPIYSISSGRFDLSIKSVTPILNDGELIGFLDLITHFNSIQQTLQKLGIESIAVATKERSKLITRPFSQNRLGDFYIANLNPPLGLLNMLTQKRLAEWMGLSESYWLEADKLVVRYPLKANNGEIHGYFFASQALNLHTAKNDAVSLIEQQSSLLLQINLVVIVLILSAAALYISTRQKRYYKDILNYEQEAVLVTNGKRMIDANTQLFVHFPGLEEGERDCICDYFEKDKGFIQKYMGETLWIDYIMQRPREQHKVKTNINGVKRVYSIRVTSLGGKASLFVAVLSDITEIQALNKKLLKQSRTDELTGIGNRLGFNETIDREMNLAIRKEQPLSIILFDIDYFKKVNDTYGHPIGDQVLVDISRLIKSNLRTTDLLYRIGGEEFVIVLSQQDAKLALELAEKIRQTVAESHFKDVNFVTISLGVTEFRTGDQLNDLLTRADSALYAAKNNGRNQSYLIE